MSALDYFLHIDVYLNTLISAYGSWTYGLLFLVVFCETGLIVTPFLPGDSLLFTVGSFAAQPANPLNAVIVFSLLIIASVLGNQTNFMIGRLIGPRIFRAHHSRLLNKRHLEKAHQYYNRHGGKTIIFARFLPIIRTFAPFIAGIGKMNTPIFFLYNLLSALLWVGSLLGLGYFLGSLPIIKANFSLVIYGIIGITLLPALFASFNRNSSSSKFQV